MQRPSCPVPMSEASKPSTSTSWPAARSCSDSQAALTSSGVGMKGPELTLTRFV